MKENPELIQGNVFADDRGFLRFVNDFNLKEVKRFYQVENFSRSLIRAFHGHMKEGKFVYVAAGTALLCIVPLDNTKNPSKNTKVERFILSSQKPQILQIPAGFANGFKSLEKNTIILFFSTSTTEESKDDDFRFPYDYWGKEIWEVENR